MSEEVNDGSGLAGAAIDPDTAMVAAPLDYVRSLHRGFTLMLVAMACAFAMYIFGAIAFASVVLRVGADNSLAMAQFVLVLSICMVVPSVIGWIGQYLMTIPDPRGVWNEAFENYRRVLRVFLWIGVVVGAISLAFVAWMFFSQTATPTSLPGPGPSGIETSVRFGFHIIVGLTTLAHMVFMMLYFEQIGIRLNDPWIAGRAKLMVWLLPLLLVLFCTVIAPIAAIVLQVQLYLRVRGGLGRVVAATGSMA